LVVVAIVFFIASLRTVGMTVLELRRHVAKHMRDNQPIYGGLGDFELYGGCQAYFDSVGTCGIYVEGNAEIAATADFISRHLLILGDDPDHYVYIFAGAIGLGAPVHLGVDEIPIIVAHHRTAQHYTGTRTIDRPWCAPKGAKRARIDELRQQNESAAHLMESARAAVIMRARSLAESARLSLSKEINAKLPVVFSDVSTCAVQSVVPSTAGLSPESAPIVPPSTTGLSSAPSVSAPIVAPSAGLLTAPSAPIVAASTAAHVRVIGMRPCCGGEDRCLIKRIGQGVMAVIISANRDFHAQFEAAGIKFGDGGSTIMTCNACKVLGGDALKESKEKYPEVIEFNYSSSKKAPAIEVKKMLTCGAMTMVTIIFL
jgi:hypothetical protein